MMITRCPECATAFRVTREQLEVRNGRVRCGHCSEVFDAVAALESAEEDLATDEPDQHDERAANAPEEAGPGEEQPVPRRSEPAVADQATQAAAWPRAWQPAPEPSPPAGDSAPASGWRRNPWWTAAAALLLVALSAQALFYFRGAIALVWPQSRPYIERLCARLGCEVPLPRRAELMSIETSDLQADPANPGVMVLSATLRNRAAFPQDYPALELTLTNDRDQPLARRVLQPADYLEAGSKERGAGLESCIGGVPSCELQIELLFEAPSLQATGYRLYLFYP